MTTTKDTTMTKRISQQISDNLNRLHAHEQTVAQFQAEAERLWARARACGVEDDVHALIRG